MKKIAKAMLFAGACVAFVLFFRNMDSGRKLFGRIGTKK